MSDFKAAPPLADHEREAADDDSRLRQRRDPLVAGAGAPLRAGRFAELDIEHLADEIEDVGKSEKRDLANRMAVLLAHLLKWKNQPENRSTVGGPRSTTSGNGLRSRSRKTRRLKAVMRGRDWQEGVWLDAVAQTCKEMGLAADDLPGACPWPMDRAADPVFWPE